MAIMKSQLKNERGNFFLPQWSLNLGSKASVLPMSYTDCGTENLLVKTRVVWSIIDVVLPNLVLQGKLQVSS